MNKMKRINNKEFLTVNDVKKVCDEWKINHQNEYGYDSSSKALDQILYELREKIKSIVEK